MVKRSYIYEVKRKGTGRSVGGVMALSKAGALNLAKKRWKKSPYKVTIGKRKPYITPQEIYEWERRHS